MYTIPGVQLRLVEQEARRPKFGFNWDKPRQRPLFY